MPFNSFRHLRILNYSVKIKRLIIKGVNFMSIIKDINLAPSGEMKINWVERNMPVLRGIGRRFSEEKPFKGLKVALSVHLEAKTAYLCRVMEMGGADLFNLDVCRKIDKERFEVSILTTVPGEQSWRQRFEDYVTDIFDLPSFLEPKDFPEFISYFIKSREIDVLFLSNSYDGYYLVPWLRAQFPELAIIDYVHMEEWYWRNGGYALSLIHI